MKPPMHFEAYTLNGQFQMYVLLTPYSIPCREIQTIILRINACDIGLFYSSQKGSVEAETGV